MTWARLSLCGLLIGGASLSVSAEALPRISVDADGSHFVAEDARFRVWGVNYDHDAAGTLLEDYWHTEWDRVEEDFREMKALGVNVVRVHLQTHRFLDSPDQPNVDNLARLRALIDVAEDNGLYLNLTGLGQYHREDIPAWLLDLDEAARWNAQAGFWSAIASVGRGRTAVFCYDLMNEPILPGKNPETDWLAGEFGGKTFVQRLALEQRGRERGTIAEQWVQKMVASIRQHDPEGLITVGVIPWGMTFPGAKPVFYAGPVAERLDFVSIHLYPKPTELDRVEAVLQSYSINKPLVIEETFPLHCDPPTFRDFLRDLWPQTDGATGFYWGEGIEYYRARPDDIASGLVAAWLEILAAGPPAP